LADEYAEEAKRATKPNLTEVDEILTKADYESNEAIEMLERLKLTLAAGHPLMKVTRD
jgi:hypothetical protein